MGHTAERRTYLQKSRMITPKPAIEEAHWKAASTLTLNKGAGGGVHLMRRWVEAVVIATQEGT